MWSVFYKILTEPIFQPQSIWFNNFDAQYKQGNCFPFTLMYIKDTGNHCQLF